MTTRPSVLYYPEVDAVNAGTPQSQYNSEDGADGSTSETTAANRRDSVISRPGPTGTAVDDQDVISLQHRTAGGIPSIRSLAAKRDDIDDGIISGNVTDGAIKEDVAGPSTSGMTQCQRDRRGRGKIRGTISKRRGAVGRRTVAMNAVSRMDQEMGHPNHVGTEVWTDGLVTPLSALGSCGTHPDDEKDVSVLDLARPLSRYTAEGFATAQMHTTIEEHGGVVLFGYGHGRGTADRVGLSKKRSRGGP